MMLATQRRRSVRRVGEAFIEPVPPTLAQQLERKAIYAKGRDIIQPWAEKPYTHQGDPLFTKAGMHEVIGVSVTVLLSTADGKALEVERQILSSATTW